MGIRFNGGFAPKPAFRARWAPPAFRWLSEGGFTSDLNAPVNFPIQVASSETPVFSVVSGNLPTGVTLTPSGVLVGSASVPSPATFTVRAVTSTGSIERTFTYTVVLPPPGPVELMPISPNDPVTLAGWTSSRFSLYDSPYVRPFNVYNLERLNGNFAQINLSKADYGATYTFKMTWQNRAVEGNPVRILYTFTGLNSGAVLRTGTIALRGSLTDPARTVTTFVGTEEPVVMRLENTYSTTQAMNFWKISVTRNGG